MASPTIQRPLLGSGVDQSKFADDFTQARRCLVAAIAQQQPDSVWQSIQRDERLASSMMRRLMRCYFEPNWEADWRDFWTTFETKGVTDTYKFEAAFPSIR